MREPVNGYKQDELRALFEVRRSTDSPDPPKNDPPKKSDVGRKVGAAVGAAVGTAFLASIVLLYICRKRRRRAAAPAVADANSLNVSLSHIIPAVPQEMEQVDQTHEMALDSHLRSELPAAAVPWPHKGSPERERLADDTSWESSGIRPTTHPDSPSASTRHLA